MRLPTVVLLAVSMLLAFVPSAVDAADDWLARAAEVRIAGRAAVVGPDQAAEILSLPGLVVIDARDADDHENERIPGSIRIDDAAWKRWSLDESIGLHDENAWRHEAARLGIDGRSPVLVIDDGSMTRAPRIWFILHRLGIRDVMVADGGLPAWRPVIGDQQMTCGPVLASASSSSPNPAAAPAAPPAESSPIAWLDRIDMLRWLGDGRVQLVDVRSPAEFDGSRPLRNPRGGHLPGARLVPHGELLTADGRLCGPAEIRAVLADHGVDPTLPIILYCQSGARATLAALALARAGVGPVACYYEGFGLWSRDDRCPVVVDAVTP